MPQQFFRGVVVSGTGQASAHTVGAFPHFPGSLNVFVGRHERSRLLDSAEHEFPSSRSVDRYTRGKLGDIPVWIGFSRDKETIELFHTANLRATLGLKDGDRVKVFL
jgi:CTP-dependent riboflavin kinase